MLLELFPFNNNEMASGGVEIPVPPKRPTVIRASKPPDNDNVVSPERPAPPVPSRPTPAVPARINDSAPARRPVAVPARPSDRPRPSPPGVSRPPPPVPGRTGEVTQVVKSNGTNKVPTQTSQGTNSKSSTGKVKPEITIVCARPMSEVGFRSENGATGPPKAAGDNNQEPTRPQRPISLPPKQDQLLIQLDDDDPSVSHSVPPQEAPPTLPSSQRPQVPPPTASRRPLPSPRLPQKSPVLSKKVIDDQTNAAADQDKESRSKGVNPKIGIPLPALPRNPPFPTRPSQVNQAHQVPQHVDNLSQINETKTGGESSVTKEQENSDNPPSGSDMYAVIDKPKRPTIIRPGRPSVKENRSEPPKLPPKISPRLDDSDTSPDTTNNDSENINKGVPEFLRHKLKSTVQNNTETQGSEKSVTAEKVTDSKPPQVAPKPKPTVLPKPKIAAKPSVASKPVIAKLEEIHNRTNHEQMPSNSSQTDGYDNKNKIANDSDSSLPKRPPSFKRPTIIRPARAVAFGSTENIKKEAFPLDVESVPASGSVDDSVVKMRSQPPLPSKRPVSMTNIPQALAQEAAAMSHRSSSSHSVQSSHSSSENLNNNAPQPKPGPRPVARSRPMSMAAGDVSSLHSMRPSVSPRLQHGTDSVSNQQGKPGSESHSHMPPKPSRQPMKAVLSPTGKISSSSEDEFVEAQTKPDRPSAPPKLGNRQSMGEIKKSPPPRPGGPPSKAHSPEDRERDEESVKMRPDRPSAKPSRPMSMPVKALLPSKPQLPKAGSGQKKHGLPSLPPRPGPGHPAYHHMMCVPHGEALFDYTARHEDELSFKQGTIILLAHAVDTEWVYGRVDNQEGIFPRGFVKVLMPLPGEKLAEDSSDENEEYYDTSPEKPDTIGYGPRCRARFDFEGEGDGDLAFEEGDVIRLLERVGTEWRKGECSGRTGLFPLAYVEVIEDLPEDDLNISDPIVKSLFDFEGEKGDLDFQAGETINVKYRVNEEWLYGEIGDRRGQFPIQFIDHVPLDLPPLPQEVKQELSPLESTSYVEQSRSTDAINDALGQWDIDDGSKTEPRLEPSMTTEQPYCIATYDYPGQTDDDLSFSEGDRIDIVERVNADWLKGKLNGIVGIFPAAFVEVKVDMQEQTTVTSPSHTDNTPEGKVSVALYEFHGEADNELTFDAGDQLIVQELVEGAEDWRWGVHEGKRGIFPAAFVDCGS